MIEDNSVSAISVHRRENEHQIMWKQKEWHCLSHCGRKLTSF